MNHFDVTKSERDWCYHSYGDEEICPKYCRSDPVGRAVLGFTPDPNYYWVTTMDDVKFILYLRYQDLDYPEDQVFTLPTGMKLSLTDVRRLLREANTHG